MKDNCPYCDTSLKLKLVLSKPLMGERKLLPKRAVAVCPKCDGAIVANSHWSETVAGAVMCGTALAAPAFKGFTQVVSPTVLGAIIIGGWTAMLVFFHWRYWRHWQRYKKAPADLMKQS